MSNRDLSDRVFYFVEKVTKWFYDKDLIKNWFNFIGWTFMTAIAFGLAESSESKVIYVVAITSAILVFFYGWHTTHEVVKIFLQDRARISSRILVASLIFATFVPVILMFYVLSVVSAYLENIL